MSATSTGNTLESSPPSLTTNAVNAERMLLEYLRSRGFKRTEQAMRDELEGSDLQVNGLNPADQNGSSSAGLVKLLTNLDVKGAEDVLSLDPTDKAEGFRELESWVDGSLDMYQARLHIKISHYSYL
jgi:transcription initiation factor TFIID subunit 5